MNAYVSKQELHLLPVNRISHPEHYAEASYRQGNLAQRVAASVRAYFARRSALAQLAALTDRELADIGVSRWNMAAAVAGKRVRS